MSNSRRIVARCPRCRGRLLFEQDPHGAYLSCLMCGFVADERRSEGGAPVATGSNWWRGQPVAEARAVPAPGVPDLAPVTG